MIERVRSTIGKYNMIKKGESVLCCLSGGADSVALLLCLLKLGADVRACHINHLLRGEESFRDEEFCSGLCSRLHVSLTVKREDAAAYAAERSLGIEEGARELRYKIFEKCGCDKIATAHTLSDCLETTIFRLARGTGLDGLVGIPPVRGNIIRPLIETTREEVEEFLREAGESYVTDSSNLSDDYSRNKIRHSVIPVLKELNPSLENSYRATLANLSEDSAFLSELSDRLYCEAGLCGGYLDGGMISQSAPPLSGRVIKRILNENDASCSRETVERIRGMLTHDGKLEIAEDIYLKTSGGRLSAERKKKPFVKFSVCAEPDNVYDFFGKTVRLTVTENMPDCDGKTTGCAADPDKITGKLTLRNRRDGDRIKFIGRAHTTKLKKLFQSSVPAQKRESVAVLADECGLVFVEGFGFSERVKTDENTKNFLICEITEKN